MLADDRPLWSLTARELCAAYAGGLSPNAVIAATLAQIRHVNPRLNAIITLDEAGAIQVLLKSDVRFCESCGATTS